MPLYERIALYSIADVAVVTATRDGMNLMPYEYIVCREAATEPSMMVVSEFVGCSPSLSGAIRVNPWSIEAVRDGIYAAIRLSEAERGLRHQKHWKYVKEHTVSFWAGSFISDLERMTREHGKMQCYDLGFALDTFRMVSLKSGFKRLGTSTSFLGWTGGWTGGVDGERSDPSTPQSSPLRGDRGAQRSAYPTRSQVFLRGGRERSDRPLVLHPSSPTPLSGPHPTSTLPHTPPLLSLIRISLHEPLARRSPHGAGQELGGAGGT